MRFTKHESNMLRAKLDEMRAIRRECKAVGGALEPHRDNWLLLMAAIDTAITQEKKYLDHQQQKAWAAAADSAEGRK